MCRSILVPLDGSAFSEHALPLALSVARRSGAQLYLAHVLSGRGGLADMAERASAASRTAYLERVAQQIEKQSVRAPIMSILTGPVAETLLEHARSVGCDLIVLTTHGRGALSRLWLGSVADVIVRRSPVPVMLVRPHQPTVTIDTKTTRLSLRRILIPLDGSPLAEAIIEHSVHIGRIMDAEYTLLRVVDPSVLGLSAQDENAGAATVAQPLKDRAQAYLERQAEELRAQGLQVDAAVMVGEPSACILDYARMHSIDLIAMATHGRGGFSLLLLGSVADKVLRGSSLPLLLYSPGVK
ncbi:universal stress protein [Roseiflexus castenholzii]|uniref:UspA domain protein n=1 Tax=Roseiflexus castenholzii (strain DSM 13941 / HLO8) TaxID=383372 RepID=A7NQG9_ROSCS|nr:universal stress protein [Roseiflexus castenholzii]ABU59815.1 UspA domain protein [Roseiflexus castenholzii DSM 13941]